MPRGRKRANGEGSIFLRKDGRWCTAVYVPLSDGTTRRKYLYGRTREEVHEKLIEAQRRAKRGVPYAATVRTVEGFLTYWLHEVAAPRLRPTTLRSYETYVRLYLIPGLGRKRLDRLAPRDVRVWLNRLRETCQCCAQGQDKARDNPRCCAKGQCCKRYPSMRTIQYVHAILRSALEHAVREDELERNVAKHVQVSAGHRPEISPLTVDEARRLLKTAQDDRLYALWVLAVTLGLRRGELLGLRWADIEFDGSRLHVRQALYRAGGRLYTSPPKTPRSRRTLSLLPLAVEALHRHRKEQEAERATAGEPWQESGLVFTTSIGTPIEPRNLNRAFAALLDRAGLRRVRLHDLRHGTATLLRALGADLRVIMEILGHSALAVTSDIYSHVRLDEQARALERLGEALGRDYDG